MMPNAAITWPLTNRNIASNLVFVAQVNGIVRRFLDESYARQDFNSPRPVGMSLGTKFISLQ